jgi:nitrite reductase (NADH) large subunit
MNKTKLILIGNGMVGHQFLASLAESGAADRFDVTVFCEEPRLAYDRVQLSAYFSGKTAEDLAMGQPAQYAAWGYHVA